MNTCTPKYVGVVRFFLLLIIGLILAMPVEAESRSGFRTRRNELRIGWGDQLFEMAMWHPTAAITIIPENPYFPPQSYREVYHENYTYTQHVFLEYQYRFNRWFALGAMADGSGFMWDDVTRDGRGSELERSTGHYCYNVLLMPTMRFTYFWHKYMNLYSGLGIGMGVNGGTEEGMQGKKILPAAAMQLTLLGFSVSVGRCFAAVDLGGLISLKDSNTIFLLESRIVSASIGVRF